MHAQATCSEKLLAQALRVLRISSLYYGYRVGKEGREATEGTLGKVRLELKNYG